MYYLLHSTLPYLSTIIHSRISDSQRWLALGTAVPLACCLFVDNYLLTYLLTYLTYV